MFQKLYQQFPNSSGVHLPQWELWTNYELINQNNQGIFGGKFPILFTTIFWMSQEVGKIVTPIPDAQWDWYIYLHGNPQNYPNVPSLKLT